MYIFIIICCFLDILKLIYNLQNLGMYVRKMYIMRKHFHDIDQYL